MTALVPVPGTVADDDGDYLADLEDEVFGASERMDHIRRFARARMVSPWSVLGCTLVIITCEIPPFVQTPDYVGYFGSLNSAAALCGPPGDGKSSSYLASLAMLSGRLSVPIKIGAGTGEGLIASYQRLVKGVGLVMVDDPRARMYVDEIAQLDAVASRGGSSVMSIFRSLWSGTEAKTSNADPAKRRSMDAHTYRFGAILGVQPATAEVLLREAGEGTPQRVLWFPTQDPRLPHPDDRPADPGVLEWAAPPFVPSAVGLWVMAFPPAVDEAIRLAHWERKRTTLISSPPSEDAHLGLARIKLAASLAVLHEEVGVTQFCWDLSGEVLEASNRTREQMVRLSAAAARSRALAAGARDHLREAGRRGAGLEAAERVARRWWAWLAAGEHSAATMKHAPGEGCTRRCVTLSNRRVVGSEVSADEVIAFALDRDWAEEFEVGGVTRFRAGGSMPRGGGDSAES